MWVKLSNEYLNLDHVFRVRVNKGFRHGEEEWVAELEGIDPKGQVGVLTRYRGADARVLQVLLAESARTDSGTPTPTREAPAAHAMTTTMPDLKLP